MEDFGWNLHNITCDCFPSWDLAGKSFLSDRASRLRSLQGRYVSTYSFISSYLFRDVVPFFTFTCSWNFPNLIPPLFAKSGQGHKMLTPAEMTKYSTETWMGLSNSPQLEEWLSPHQSDCDKDRLCVIGNIVVPQMGYFAANMLAQAWKAWTSHAQCAT